MIFIHARSQHVFPPFSSTLSIKNNIGSRFRSAYSGSVDIASDATWIAFAPRQGCMTHITMDNEYGIGEFCVWDQIVSLGLFDDAFMELGELNQFFFFLVLAVSEIQIYILPTFLSTRRTRDTNDLPELETRNINYYIKSKKRVLQKKMISNRYQIKKNK